MSFDPHASTSTCGVHDDDIFDDTFDEIFETGLEECVDDYTRRQAAIKPRKTRVPIERGREEGHIRLWNDYFSEQPIYPDAMFRRRFRMNKRLFFKIVQKLSNELPFFQQRQDATRRFGLSALQKCTAAIRIMAYGLAADATDEYLWMAESTASKCLEKFVDGIIRFFQDEYLRKPTPEDLQRLLYIGEFQGFSGIIGSIDCMHWEWKNCPTAWKGQYSRGHSKPTIVYLDLARIFGPPGTCNDLNVLDRSPVFDDILREIAPTVSYYVNGRQYNMTYYLTDCIYLKWATFIQSISQPQGPKASLFAQCQEAVRKDVERAFGVLQARFAVIRNLGQCMEKSKLGKIMRACIILHNMIVEDERDECTQYDLSEFLQGEGNGTSQVEYTYSTETPTNVNNMMANRARVHEKKIHEQLKDDLVEHIWQKHHTTG